MIVQRLVAGVMLAICSASSVGCSDESPDAEPTTSETTTSDSETTAETTTETTTETTVPGTLTGTTGSTPPDSPAVTTTTIITTTTVEALIAIRDQPGDGEFDGAKDDITESDCSVVGGVWTYSGTVANPTDDDVEYRIFVAFLDQANDTLALIQAENSLLAAEQSAEFAVEFTSTATGLSCVPRVERRIL
jgi:hypothetical protein